MVDYINKNESASYAELQWLFEKKGYDYKGKLLSCSDVCEHVVFWSGWNAEAFDLMTELLHEGVAYRGASASPAVSYGWGRPYPAKGTARGAV